MYKIIDPTLDLFLYDLGYGLGEDENQQKNNYNYFLAKMPKKCRLSHEETLNKNNQNIESEFIELLKTKNDNDKETRYLLTINNNERFNGFYYPVRLLGDTYGLLVECSFKDDQIPYPLENLKTLKYHIYEILQKNYEDNNTNNGKQTIEYPHPTIGQTWMMSGKLPPLLYPDPEEIAKKCYEKLIPHGNVDRDLKGKGTFLGGYIFEFWRYELQMEKVQGEDEKHKPKQPIKYIPSNAHVIIALYPSAFYANPDIKQNPFDYLYEDWMRLFSYRAKIMWAYGQSRDLERRIKGKFEEIQTKLKEVRDASEERPSIKNIQEILKTVSRLQGEYEDDLIAFKFQFTTIEVNLNNYKKRLKLIRQKAEKQQDELTIWTPMNIYASS